MQVHKSELPSRENLLGVGIHPINMTIAIDTIRQWILNKASHYICVTPAHSVMDAYHDPVIRKIFNQSGLTTPDGMPLVWLLKLRGFKDVDRVYGPDLLQAACREFVPYGYRHYFLGGSPEVTERLCQVFRERYPGIKFAGSYSPPFRPLSMEEENQMISRINSVQPDILWVAFGAPRQELWMAEHINQLNCPVLIGVGAAFDFLAGNKKQAPRWIQRSGFEWLYRLLKEPKRLWKRYLLNYPKFVFLVFLQLLGLKKFSMD